jgi:ribonuclease HII
MSYSACWCPADWEPELRTLGAADSKAMDEAAREKCFTKLCDHPDKLAWAVHLIAPATISRQMLRRFVCGFCVSREGCHAVGWTDNEHRGSLET